MSDSSNKTALGIDYDHLLPWSKSSNKINQNVYHIAEGNNNLDEDFAVNTDQTNKEFIRKLVNDYIHYKIYGCNKQAFTNEGENEFRKQITEELQNNITNANYKKTDSNNNNNNDDGSNHNKKFRKVSITLRRVSMELERSNSLFFEEMCDKLELQTRDPQKTFKAVSEEVMAYDELNWGRVVSMFTFGGKLAEWFWKNQEVNKVEEIEDWLTDTISTKNEWIEKNGGWDAFNDLFETNTSFWLKGGLLVCLGVSLTALLTFRR